MLHSSPVENLSHDQSKKLKRSDILQTDTFALKFLKILLNSKSVKTFKIFLKETFFILTDINLTNNL